MADVSEYRDKLATIATPRKWGSSNRVDKIHEDTGRKAGYEMEHWDDRRDAVVQIEHPVKKNKNRED